MNVIQMILQRCSHLTGFMTVVPVESLVGGQRVGWESEDIDQGLAADLDDSLSGLGVDISTVSTVPSYEE